MRFLTLHTMRRKEIIRRIKSLEATNEELIRSSFRHEFMMKNKPMFAKGDQVWVNLTGDGDMLTNGFISKCDIAETITEFFDNYPWSGNRSKFKYVYDVIVNQFEIHYNVNEDSINPR